MTEATAFDLDPEIEAFIEKTGRHYPDDAATLDATGQRAVYDAMCAAFDLPVPGGLTIRDDLVPADAERPAIPVRVYTPAQARPNTLILYMHGGGFVVGGLDSHHGVCGELSVAANCVLVSVDYRLAPEHSHPAQIEDCLAAFRHFSAAFDKIIVAGDSAGGNLAAALCVATRNGVQKPVGAVLIYPGLGGDQLDLTSYTTMAQAPMLTTADVHLYHRLRQGDAARQGESVLFDEALAAPLLADDLRGHPPTAIFSAGTDPLCDDGTAYADRLLESGTAARCHTETGLVHGYLRARRMSRKAKASFARICQATKSLAESGLLPETDV